MLYLLPALSLIGLVKLIKKLSKKEIIMSTETVKDKPIGEPVAFQAEIKQVLDILIHSLYSEPEIFLRELVSNASDALNRFKFQKLTAENVLDPEAELGIWIKGDSEAKTLTITDTGIGMTAEEMTNSLGTIAKSGAREFITALKEQGKKAEDVIGQFGVGFYSVFMVAEEVKVISHSFDPKAESAVWTSTGEGTFTVTKGDKKDRGTRIEIKLKDDHKDFAESYRLNSVIKAHSDFVEFPIYIHSSEGEEKKWEQANEQTAIWRKSPRDVEDEKYKSFYQSLTFDYGDPLLRLHLNTDVPLQLYSLLYVPSKRDWRMFRSEEDYGLKLYVRKVMIQEKFKDLLPPYLRFVQGVVDSEDLPLNVSRQMVQASPLIKKIKDVLVGRIATELKRLAKDDEANYRKFWKEFGMFLKEGVASDFEHKDKWLELLRFSSSRSQSEDDLLSLKDYVGRMKEGQDAIYYVTGENFNVVKRSPHLDYFRKHEIEVLFFIDAVDTYMIVGLNEFEGKSFKNVDDADLKLPEEDAKEDNDAEALAEEAFISLKERVKRVLGERVTDVRESKLLSNSPCRLVNPEGGMNSSMQRMQLLMGGEYEVPKKMLELNRKSSLVQNLSAKLESDPNDALLEPLIEQLYESALLSEGLHPNPAEMLPRIEQLMEAAVK